MEREPVEQPAGRSVSEETYRNRLRELPPSAKLVAKTLEQDGPLRQSEIATESLLPDRTVRYGLSRLQEADLVEASYDFSDPRKRIYSIVK